MNIKNSSAYTRKEIEDFGEGFPQKGIYCQKCKIFIPVFEEMTERLETRIRQLIRYDRKLKAIEELKAGTGCSLRWAKIWVVHAGVSTPEYLGPPCPYCGKPLRTLLAKLCTHCYKSWHNK